MHLDTKSLCRSLFWAGATRSTRHLSICAFLAPSWTSPSESLPRRGGLKVHHQKRSASTDVLKQTLLESPEFLSIGRSRTQKSSSYDDIDIHGNSDPNSWVDLLEPILPPELRSPVSSKIKATVIAEVDTAALPHILFKAGRSCNIDVLHYLGITLGRWEAVVWIVQNLPKGELFGHPYHTPENDLQRLWSCNKSLDQVTNDDAIWLSLDPVSPDGGNDATIRQTKILESLDQVTARFGDIPGTENDVVYRKALGRVWQSLGRMILSAVQREAEVSRMIMANVLRIVAHLHHIGIIPPSVYTYNPNQDPAALQQPPTLQLLSSRILSSLSDVTLNALKPPHANEPALAKFYQTDGIVWPGARYRTRIYDLGPELWLELILWSCVHGGWPVEAASILAEMSSYTGTARWRLICWSELLDAPKPEDNSGHTVTWDELKTKFQASGPKLPYESANRSDVERTISSEVVVAVIDGLINSLHVGIGHRGNAPRLVVEHILTLSNILHRDQLSLGASSWNAVIIRLLESEGINVEGDPVLMEEILSLTPRYGTELSPVKTPSNQSNGNFAPTYIFDGSAAPLGIYHRVLQAFIDRGDVGGALRAFGALHRLTDYNKRKSLEDFFQELKSVTHATEARGTVGFESNISRIDFPGFYTQIPSPVLASLLDLVTEAGEYEFGKWMLYSNEVDGPVISERMYADLALAGSILDFASATKDKPLLLKVTNALKDPYNFEAYSSNTDKGEILDTDQQPSRVVSNLILLSLRSQIKRGKRSAAEAALDYLKDVPDYRWTPFTLAQLITDLIRYSMPVFGIRNNSGVVANRIKTIIRGLRGGDFGSLEQIRPDQINTILGVISSVDTSLAEFCSDLLWKDEALKVELPPKAFNAILEVVVDVFGSLRGKELWDRWCETQEVRLQARKSLKEVSSLCLDIGSIEAKSFCESRKR